MSINTRFVFDQFRLWADQAAFAIRGVIEDAVVVATFNSIQVSPFRKAVVECQINVETKLAGPNARVCQVKGIDHEEVLDETLRQCRRHHTLENAVEPTAETAAE